MNNFMIGMEQVLSGKYGYLLLQGIIHTLELAALAWSLAIALAFVLLVARLTGYKWAEWPVAAYISYHRNVPTLVQLMVWYFGLAALLPEGMQLWLANYNAEFIYAVIALGLCQAAYFSEDIRSGLRAIQAGQSEASHSLGLGYLATLRFVILPQAVRNAFPSLLNHTVLLFKNTSLAMIIGCVELTYATSEIENDTFLTFQTYLITTLIYMACSLALLGSGTLLERHLSKVYVR